MRYNTRDFFYDVTPAVTVLPAGNSAQNAYGHRFGSQLALLNDAQMNALKEGKQLAVDIMEGEYVLFLQTAGSKEG